MADCIVVQKTIFFTIDVVVGEFLYLIQAIVFGRYYLHVKVTLVQRLQNCESAFIFADPDSSSVLVSII
jgi:hypothetical protein